ncbi:uncharacterized protein [Haliotis asinina]|uniref:uncharacterized protein n=1 Tax=Haliotis asinina TaxID=109174 RepID=UPI003531A0E9
MPILPRRRDDIDLPDHFAKTATNADFLLHATDHNKIMIFATDENLRHLAAVDVYYCDGTFSMCPSLFYQMYTIHAFVDGKMSPLVYGLLPDKKQSTYTDFFRPLKQNAAGHSINLRPSTFFSDFEKGAQNAAKEVIQCELKGCMFHYRQALVKHARNCGLQGAYKNDDNVRTFVRRALALSLVRVCDVENFWCCALLVLFADYVTEQRVEGGELLLWNHFDTDGPRTTNHVEGWHSHLNTLSACHPNLFKFVDLLKQQQSRVEITISQLQNGGSRHPRKKLYRALDDRLTVLKMRLVNGTYTPDAYGDLVSDLVGVPVLV